MGQSFDKVSALADTTLTSGCKDAATAWAKKASAMYKSIAGTSPSSYNGNFFNSLLTSGNALLILNSELNSECQNINKIKQFSVRTTKMSGLFNLLFTAGYSYFTQDTLYTSLNNLKDYQTAPCEEVGFNLANVMMTLLQTTTATDTNSQQISAFGSGMSGTQVKV